MKKILLTAALAFSSLWPLACANRPFSTPIRPLLPTATPTQVTARLICTITPTPPVTQIAQATPVTNNGFGTAQSLGTFAAEDVDVNGNLAGTSADPDNDYYSFTAGDSGPCTLYLDCFLAPPTPLEYVYDSSQALIGTYAISASGNPTVTFSATSGQLYYLRVSGYGGQNYTAKMFLP